MVRIKRVYEPPSAADGKRLLVERLWPRGLTKQKAKVCRIPVPQYFILGIPKAGDEGPARGK